jgi:hypothetical protein
VWFLDGTGVYSRAIRPYLSPRNRSQGRFDGIMRPEIQTQLDNAKQSIGLLRRHL